jgi:hypothetical protein
MAKLLKERVPCCQIEDKYIDALSKRNQGSLCLDLALLVIITRFEIIPPLSDLSYILNRSEFEIECSLNNLTDVGFLSLA